MSQRRRISYDSDHLTPVEWETEKKLLKKTCYGCVFKKLFRVASKKIACLRGLDVKPIIDGQKPCNCYISNSMK